MAHRSEVVDLNPAVTTVLAIRAIVMLLAIFHPYVAHHTVHHMLSLFIAVDEATTFPMTNVD